jgi:hypothetical protein
MEVTWSGVVRRFKLDPAPDQRGEGEEQIMAARVNGFRNRLLVFWLIVLFGGCKPTTASKPPAAPAEKPKAEVDLSRTTLSDDAVKRLGVYSEPVRNQEVQEHLTLTGWVMAQQGNEVSVTAPVAGYVRAASPSTGWLGVGLTLNPGRQLLQIEPVLSPVEQIQMAALQRGVEAEFSKAKENVELVRNQAELINVQAQGDLWRAAAEIAGLLQQDGGFGKCPAP